VPLFSTATRPVTVHSRRQTTPGCTPVTQSATTSSMVNSASGFTFTSTSSTSRECCRKFNGRTRGAACLLQLRLAARWIPTIEFASRRRSRRHSRRETRTRANDDRGSNRTGPDGVSIQALQTIKAIVSRSSTVREHREENARRGACGINVSFEQIRDRSVHRF